MCNLYPPFPGQVVVVLELLLQLQGLVSTVSLSASPTLRRIGSYKQTKKNMISMVCINM